MGPENQLNLLADFQGAEKAAKPQSELSPESETDKVLRKIHEKLDKTRPKPELGKTEDPEAEEKLKAYWQKVNSPHPEQVEPSQEKNSVQKVESASEEIIKKPVKTETSSKNQEVPPVDITEESLRRTSRRVEKIKNDADHDSPSFDLYGRFNKESKED